MDDFKWPFRSQVLGLAIRPFNKRECRMVIDAVYLIFDKSGYLAYVGKTEARALAGRISQHSKQDWFGSAFYIKTDTGGALHLLRAVS